MKYKLLIDSASKVVDIWASETESFPSPPVGNSLVDYIPSVNTIDSGIGGTWTGNKILKTKSEVESILVKKITKDVESLAISWDYDSSLSAISYIGSANSKFNNEGLAIRDWRNELWEFVIITISNFDSYPKSLDEIALLIPTKPSRPL